MQAHNQDVYSIDHSNLYTWANNQSVVADVVALHCMRHAITLSTVTKGNKHTIKAYITPKQADTINNIISTVVARIDTL